jgi:hypothetical protein
MPLHKFSFVMMGVVLCYFAFRNRLKLKSGLNSNGLQILNGFEKKESLSYFSIDLGPKPHRRPNPTSLLFSNA